MTNLAHNVNFGFVAWGVFVDNQLLATFNTKSKALRYMLYKGIRRYATVARIV